MFLMDESTDSDSPIAQCAYRGSCVTMIWENLTVYIDNNNNQRDSFVKNIFKKCFRISKINYEKRKILDSVSGYAKSGNLIAIMGPSGAGKTTLLAALARKIESNFGIIKVNGSSVSKNEMSKISGYLPQFDAMPTVLTAMEYMSFTCALRLDKRTCVKERNVLAANIFSQLGLLEISDTYIEKLSGGEKKRLSLAIELVTKPKILFLDEPTSGLDTWTAMKVIESVKAEARNGTLVFCSIHQPAMDIYKMFSHVILLANGRTAYHGTLENAKKYFNSEGFHCPESFNEAEYYVKIVSNGNFVDSLNVRKSFLVSENSDQIDKHCPHSTSSLIQNYDDIDFKFQRNNPNTFFQFYWVMWRILIETRRTMFQDKTNHFTFFLSAILVCSFYYRANSQTQSGIQDIRGALYAVSSEIIFSSAYSVIYIIPSELPLYLREHSMYGPAVYYIATIIGLTPKLIFHAVAFFAMMLLAMDSNASVFTYMLFFIHVIIATIASLAYGTMASSWSETPEITALIMTPIDIISVIMAGVYYNIRSIPVYLSWLRYLSIFYYTNEALEIIYWRNVDSIECYSDKDLPCIKSGREVLNEYGHDEYNLWLDAGGLLLLTFALHVFGYLGVKRRRAMKSMY